ncbi:MAG: Yip1 family protein [Ferruginibacter sp.]
MNLIERVKNILITPKTEWDVINGETATAQSLLMGYVLPLAVVSAAGALLKGLLFAGTFGFKFFIITALIGFIASVVAYYISVIIIDMLAPSFGSEKNLGKSAQLVAYSGTPSYVAGLLSFIPVIGMILPFAAWVYGIYLMYLGIGPLKKTPEDKKIVYMIVAFLIMIAINLILVAILTGVLFAALGMGAAGGLF